MIGFPRKSVSVHGNPRFVTLSFLCLSAGFFLQGCSHDVARPCWSLPPPDDAAPLLVLEPGAARTYSATGGKADYPFRSEWTFTATPGTEVMIHGLPYRRLETADVIDWFPYFARLGDDTLFVVRDTSAAPPFHEWTWFWHDRQASYPWPLFVGSDVPGTRRGLFSIPGMSYEVTYVGRTSLEIGGETVTHLDHFRLHYAAVGVMPWDQETEDDDFYVRRGVGIVRFVMLTDVWGTDGFNSDFGATLQFCGQGTQENGLRALAP